MDITLSEDEELFRRNARDVLRREHPPTAVREAEASELGYDPALYKKLGELGYLGLLLPEDLGGSGGSWLYAVLFHEEAGRVLLAGPYLHTTVGALVLARHGSQHQKALVSRVAAGEATIGLAIAGPDGSAQTMSVSAGPARQDGKQSIIGRSSNVAWGGTADALIVATAMNTLPESQDGRLVLVDSGEYSVTKIPVMSGEQYVDVEFDCAIASELRDANWQALDLSLNELSLLEAARCVGMAAELLDRAAEYAKIRAQFGRPIGSFQAIQHMLSDLSVEVDGSRLLVQETAWRYDAGEDWQALVPHARLCAANTLRLAARVGHQVHGGYGFIMETDVQLFIRRSKQYEVNATGSERQRDRIAASLGI